MRAVTCLYRMLSVCLLLVACQPAHKPPDDAGPMDAGVPRATSISFSIDSTFTIADAGGLHDAFPDVTRLSDDSLMLVYRQGASHVDPTGRIMKQFGSADGLTWTAPEVLYDTPNVDDRDPSVKALSDGSVVVNEFQYPVVQEGDAVFTETHVFVGRSTDNGKTFGTFKQVDPSPFTPDPALQGDTYVDSSGHPIRVEACSSPIVESNGLLMLPTYGGMLYGGSNITDNTHSRMTLYEATDPAGPWTAVPIDYAQLPDTWLEEPAILPLGGQRLLLQARSASGSSASNAGYLLQTTSNDNGMTWDTIQPLGFVGHAPDLHQLANGVIISSFRELPGDFSQEWVGMMWSLDDGATWSDPWHIVDCHGVECGYPSIMELAGNKVLIVYYAPGGVGINAIILSFTAGYD